MGANYYITKIKNELTYLLQTANLSPEMTESVKKLLTKIEKDGLLYEKIDEIKGSIYKIMSAINEMDIDDMDKKTILYIADLSVVIDSLNDSGLSYSAIKDHYDKLNTLKTPSTIKGTELNEELKRLKRQLKGYEIDKQIELIREFNSWLSGVEDEAIIKYFRQ